MIFGEEEIRVEARNTQTGDLYVTNLRYKDGRETDA